MPSREEKIKGTADFGFRDVPERDKPSLVRAVFDSVAPRYDLMNDLMSGGLHRLWKAALIDRLMPRPGMALLDLAGGTGDIAFRFLDAVKRQGHAVVLDASPAMLAVGRDRAMDRGLLGAIEWISGDAEALPFPDRTFDACTIAFGLRNVTHKDRALAEARRVLRPGGRFLCLEFSHVVLPLLDQLYRRYSFSVVPWLGAQVAGDREAYEYLVESIRRFPDQETLSGMIATAGLERVQLRNLSGGIAALHSAWRI
ncbi:MAG: bifunctional demethylmenaquinone methyltransferase/2-methoxy-6-polyprenyl-1,4-benzoquinol methylase UbiE [Alphaproteobacteria bacterium]|nr:bifunctional demethylmenaquinone methyltransferase/2-methoxy-6-polyprenyl-1,4-benzoquinol methylase UbiE [Alphaproteobacteria bacterium]